MNIHAALLRTDITNLGDENLSQWLIDSYCGTEPVQAPGYFEYVEDQWLSAMISANLDQFDKGHIDTLQTAISVALKHFGALTPQGGTCGGLFGLVSLACALKDSSALPVIAGVLQKWFPPTGLPTRPIVVRDEILALRDLLDLSYVLLVEKIEALNIQRRDVSIKPKQLEHFRALCCWSYLFMRTPRHDRDLVPALAPIYFFALTHHFCFSNLRDGDGVFNMILKAGRKLRGDSFPEIYRISSSRFPGAWYAYDIDSIMERHDPFVALLVGHGQPGIAKPVILRVDDPMAASLSATSGARGLAEDGEAVRDCLDRELLAAA